ncbi:MAG: Hpt domain-containing protein [Deltaproteobacteria bacterium]|nr:Hpt domain-containing protein [Deltaproteobacteria bacterium]
MRTLLNYLLLPREITAFERTYLRRLNRIALVFFYLHVPVFIAVAWLAGNSPLQAAVLTPLVLIGPTIVYFRFANPRALSVASGFTAMVMGGLLVHFGAGPMQIEMHFYFFVLLALLAVFANPMAIVTAAVTVAVHHLVVWMVLPRSVFNYDASFWTVAVHALFVVIESVAAVFVARSFFDNVIGLEKIVGARTTELAARTRDMRLVLDSVGQGFLTVGPDGAMSTERSAILATWLGPPSSDDFFAYLGRVDAAFGAGMRMGFDEVFADVMPLELTLAQLPARLEANGRHLAFEYKPIGAGPVPTSLLVVVSDITAEVERERADLVRRELLAVFERFGKDKAGFIEFYDEADGLVKQIAEGDLELSALKRVVHTLKGNAAIFGVESIAGFCHVLETRMTEDEAMPTAEERGELVALWRAFATRLDTLLGARDVRTINVTEEELARVVEALRAGAPAHDVASTIAAWRLELVDVRFARVAEQASRLAQRLGKDIQVEVHGNDVRLDPRQWTGLWSAFVHAVRNAVDHGVEDAAERVASGKPAIGRVDLSARVDGGHLRFEIKDDGRGVDWERVRARASAAGLPHATSQELVDALFSDGFSTKDGVSDLSGRGVGLGALRAAATAAGGQVTLVSERGLGTLLQLSFPNAARRELEQRILRISQRIAVM